MAAGQFRLCRAVSRSELRLRSEVMGHAPTSVLTRHYAQISHEMLRDSILPAIEKRWHKSGILTDPSSQIQSKHGLASEPQ